MIETGSTLRQMSPSGRTQCEMLFGESGRPEFCIGSAKAALPTFLAGALYLWMRSKGLCEDLTDEVSIERTPAPAPNPKPVCNACTGQGGRFDGDPTRGLERWIVCPVCNGGKS